MSKVRSISSLSKEELLSLIYHILPDTHIDEHPCECASCGEEEIGFHMVGGHEAQMYSFICQGCEAAPLGMSAVNE